MFEKDSSGVVINTQDSHYKAILARRQEKAAREALEQQFNDLQNELLELKALVQQAITGNNHG
jgi:hypothetical protein